MTISAELKSSALLIIGAIFGAGLHSAYVADRSEEAPGFLEADDLPVDPSFFDGAVDATSARRLDGESDVPFIQNRTNRRCAQWDQGDRLFAKSDMDLPSCYAECEKRDRCNHFSIAMTGPNAGRCIGCKEGLLEFKKHYVFFTMQRSDQDTSFSCPDGLVMQCAQTSSTTSTSTSTDMYAFEPANRTELKEAVDMWLTNKTEAIKEYGDISSWSTSLVTDMSFLFWIPGLFWENLGADGQPIVPGFNDDISGWDVSRVTTMEYMFYEAGSFNQDLSAWDVSNVEQMEGMFVHAINFDQSLSAWDVSKVVDMSLMFASAWKFNGDLSSWSVGNAQNMASMFADARAFNQDISRWNVSMVQDMGAMFQSAMSFNQDISQWDVSSVTNMVGMFRWCSTFNQSITSWDVSRVTTMSNMFYGADAFLNVDVSVWNPTSLTTAPRRFISAASVACTDGDWSHWGSNVPSCY